MVAWEFDSQLWAASSCGRLKLSKTGKDSGSAAEGRGCFLQQVGRIKEIVRIQVADYW